MFTLTRRKFLTGAPAVAMVAAGGVAAGALVKAPTGQVLIFNKMPPYVPQGMTITLSDFATRIVNPSMDRLRAGAPYIGPYDRYEAA